MGDDYLGEFEHLVLLAIIRLGDDAYGVLVRRTIIEKGERSVSFGAVYSTLRRLEKKSYIESCGQTQPGSAGGRPRKTFRLTKSGLHVVRAAQRRMRRMIDGVPQVAEERGT